MKKGLLATTALVGAGALFSGAALAAEAPEWKLSGNMNFQFYYVDQDLDSVHNVTSTKTVILNGTTGDFQTPLNIQNHGWYFGVDEAELALNVSGAADNGLKYGFKIEIQVNTDDTKVADEARIQLSGNWGTLQLGDEDGAEDIMNYGGENLMGATGGFDGDFGDVLLRTTKYTVNTFIFGDTFTLALHAPSGPSIAGDTSDATKISYYSPRFSGFQVGASITPTPNDGDNFKADSIWENHYGIGANYDNSFGGVRLRASAVYSAASSNFTGMEDISAWSVGGIVGFGAFSVGANYTDNGESGLMAGQGMESSYWNAAASFETGPLKLAAGYFSGTFDWGLMGPVESTFENISLTADYKVAPGLLSYAEIDLITDEPVDGLAPYLNNDATIFIAGVKVSF